MATLDRDELGQLAGGPSPPLWDGQQLDQPTFHELYLQTPKHFRAELIEGVVHVMASPVSLDHSLPDIDFGWFLRNYAIETPGILVAGNATTKLDDQNEVQPDIALLIEEKFGGQTVKDNKGYIVGCPELVVEIASSTLSNDLGIKRRIYEEAEVREYIVVDVGHRALFWFTRTEDVLEPLVVGPDGIYRSVFLPGLWLDAPAFFREDLRSVNATLARGIATPEHAAFVDAIAQRRANRP